MGFNYRSWRHSWHSLNCKKKEDFMGRASCPTQGDTMLFASHVRADADPCETVFRHPSDGISAVCLSYLTYSLINVSTVATAAVFLNARLNLFTKRGARMCGQALSSERLLLLIIAQTASPSLCLSPSAGDMITAAPHQSHGAVTCPTFNINTAGCHGGGWQGCPLVPTSPS